MCKGVHYVDLGESFPTHVYLQNLASILTRNRHPVSIEIDAIGELLAAALHFLRSVVWSPIIMLLRCELCSHVDIGRCVVVQNFPVTIRRHRVQNWANFHQNFSKIY